MTFITSRLSFGAYNFPSGFWLDYRQQDTTVDIVKLPYQDGANIPPGTRSEKIISIKGMLGGIGAVDSAGAYIQTRDQLENEANLMESNLAAGYQQLVFGATPARFLAAQKTKFKATYEPGTAQTCLNIEIEFTAQDPRSLSATQSTLGTTSGTLTNNGSALTWPKFTITGATANATITVTPLGLGGIKLALLNGVISSGSLLIDTDPRNRVNGVLLNGVPSLNIVDYINSQNNNGDSSFFPYMNAGSNTLATTGISALSTAWNDAYLF